ncbi:MAG: hypothetical protein ACRDSZ_05365 [Pseudonocardiaceae bacterium]
MAGKHSSIGALRSWLFADRPAQQATIARPAAIEMVDARTLAAHLVTDEAIAVGRQRGKGRYIARCGVEVLAASLTQAPQRPCRSCAPIPSQNSRSNR